MDSLLKSLAANAPTAILALLALSIVLLAIVLSLNSKVRRMSQRWHELFDGAKGDNIERLLYDHLRERMQLQEQIDALGNRVGVLEEKVAGAKRHLGLVKYDAFEDVGGSQSFAMALYDDRGDGALLTSLIGRSDCRVYAKPLIGGRSERSLSQEEQRAVQTAVETGPKSILSQ